MNKNSDKGRDRETGMSESPIHVQKARMAPQKNAPPGLEQDSHGDVIPLDQRTEDDKEKARAGHK
jgi:hypothetical protein